MVSQEAHQTTLVQQRVEAANHLAILFDGPPKSLAIAEPENLDGIRLPEVAPGLPAYLLARRPDVRAAEARLRVTLAMRRRPGELLSNHHAQWQPGRDQ